MEEMGGGLDGFWKRVLDSDHKWKIFQKDVSNVVEITKKEYIKCQSNKQQNE